jgi:hypothetical protein
MIHILKYIITLTLTIGVLFLTADCESYFGEIGYLQSNQNVTLDNSGDIEHTHDSHQSINDIFSDTNTNEFPREIIFSVVKISYIPLFRYNYFICIWQPPKFS